MNERDNVATCVADINAGESVVFRREDEFVTVKAIEPIGYCHKIALRDINEGEAIIKYGESIGVTTSYVKKGAWVAHHNLVSVSRDYESEMIKLKGE